MKLIPAILLIGLLAGCCATIPDVTLNYYPAKWSTVATVTQTVGCNDSKTHIFVLNTPSVKTTYSSDFNAKPLPLNIKNLESEFADSDMTMTFTDDGRLKSINQSTTGQGEAIVKSAVSLATATLFTAKAYHKGPLDECTTIDKLGAGKPVTLTYTAKIDSSKLGKTVSFSAENKALYNSLQKQLPKLSVSVSNASDLKSGPSYTPPAGISKDVVLLDLQKTGSVGLKIKSGSTTIGTSSIVIPEAGTYQLPIPKAAFFGKQTFALTLSEAGAVTSIGYGDTVGTAGALNALSSIANTKKTVATKAADIKAQADLIAQQQRLVLCQTKPDQCQ